MKVIVAGSRKWDESYKYVIDSFMDEHLTPGDIVITGGAKGVDTIAHQFASSHGYATVVVPAQWSRFGKAAGPIRNKAMLDLLEEGDQVWTFFIVGVDSPGTAAMERLARGLFTVFRVRYDPEQDDTQVFEIPCK